MAPHLEVREGGRVGGESGKGWRAAHEPSESSSSQTFSKEAPGNILAKTTLSSFLLTSPSPSASRSYTNSAWG